MVNQEALKELIEQYKKNFTEKHWEDEKYKWQAVKYFQDHWDIHAPNFGEMFFEATKEIKNLLDFGNNFPRGMIVDFAAFDDKATRQMFVDLYNDSVPLSTRVEKFKSGSNELLARYNVSYKAKRHFQDDKAISTYLWLMYPEKYYIYKFTTVDTVAKKLGSSYRPKQRQADFGENIKGAYEMYDEICAELQKDEEFREILKKNIDADDTCWPDESLHTATQDFGFFVENLPTDPKKPRYWLYAPGEKAIYWDEFYQAGIMAIGWDVIGDLSKIADKSEMQKIMTERIDPGSSNKNDAKATWQFVHEMKPGDIIFVKRGRSKIIGRGEVVSGYEYDASRDYYKNVRKVKWTHRGEWDYPWIRVAVTKTLTDMTPFPELVENLKALFPEPVPVPVPPVPVPPSPKKYGKDEFLDEVYIFEEQYDELVELLKYKKNVILQGPPGVGKTFAAKRLAYSIMGEKDDSRIEFVQFHQNYSYEDFVMGYKPTEKGFELKNGIFYEFCDKASKHPDKDYFFIIDEINRGNMSKIFGELLMLIENDKREEYSVTLPYTGKSFKIPKNLYIIGMMNTADRSLAMIDYALRRRFAFFTMVPAFKNDKFVTYVNNLKNEKLKKLIEQVKNLNKAITEDKSFGEDFCIGHSYFCGLDNLKDTNKLEERLRAIVEFEIKPMIHEYCFADSEKSKKWEDILEGKSEGKSNGESDDKR